jgi:hypothetical protein
MRGSIQYNDMLQMSVPERMAVHDFISKRLEIELKKPSPHAIY